MTTGQRTRSGADASHGRHEPAAIGAEPSAVPVDVLVMRQTIALVLPAEDELPLGLDLDTLIETLRGHMELIVPEAETKALALHADDVPRYCALACVGEANGKLRARAGSGAYASLVIARRLARSLAALCDHYETLTGMPICLVCDWAIHRSDSVPYDRFSNSGGAVTSHIHAACANPVGPPLKRAPCPC
ncbi:DUF6415 family natural product biosynthesis protein [Streptomyces sp. NPDC048566]|uniref:DUF6415 family natural product biosynthesis protein n=1 Tax=Streptomyces sp. NPDC048566 TaxID=3365569 RepID=UPI0037180E96